MLQVLETGSFAGSMVLADRGPSMSHVAFRYQDFQREVPTPHTKGERMRFVSCSTPVCHGSDEGCRQDRFLQLTRLHSFVHFSCPLRLLPFSCALLEITPRAVQLLFSSATLNVFNKTSKSDVSG